NTTRKTRTKPSNRKPPSRLQKSRITTQQPPSQTLTAAPAYASKKTAGHRPTLQWRAQSQMLSSRNIHFAILGIILGATSGYIFAFYQIDKNIPDKTRTLNGEAQGHPKVSNEQVLAMFKTQIEKNPNDAELLSRYADFLSDIERYPEAVDAYKKVLAIEPSNITAQTFMGTALWNLGKKDEAIALYQK